MKVNAKTEKGVLLHQLRNCLGPIQTFPQAVAVDSNPELKNFHKLCQENLVKLHTLLKQLEEI